MTTIDPQKSPWSGMELSGSAQRAPWMEMIRLWTDNGEAFDKFSTQSAKDLLGEMERVIYAMENAMVVFEWIEHQLA
jgi:hypothetical protein